MGIVKIAMIILVIVIALLFIKRMKKTPAPTTDPVARPEDEFRAPPEEQSFRGVCQRCGQERLLINKKVGYCASCWSSHQTKPLA